MKRPSTLVSCLPIILIIICLVAWAETKNSESSTTIDLTECADRQLEFRMFCNPRWPLHRDNGKLTMEITANPQEESVGVTVTRLEELGLGFDDLTPTALSRVFNYGDNFTYARTKIKWNKAIRVEAQSHQNSDEYLLDYFFINDGRLYRISYSANGRESYRRYLPLFLKMISSFDFLKK
jgi:hypothetical protein